MASGTVYNVVPTETITGHTIYDIKMGLQTEDHNGWILLDGRAISELTTTQQAYCTAFGWSSTLPDPTSCIPRGSDLTTLGATAGSDWKIDRANLPKVNLGGSSMPIKPYGSITVTDSGHKHTYYYREMYKVTRGSSNISDNSASDGYAGSAVVTESSNAIETGKDDKYTFYWKGYSFNSSSKTTGISCTFTGTSTNYTTPNAYLNGNVTQTAFAPPTFGVNYFVYLGEA